MPWSHEYGPQISFYANIYAGEYWPKKSEKTMNDVNTKRKREKPKRRKVSCVLFHHMWYRAMLAEHTSLCANIFPDVCVCVWSTLSDLESSTKFRVHPQSWTRSSPLKKATKNIFTKANQGSGFDPLSVWGSRGQTIFVFAKWFFVDFQEGVERRGNMTYTLHIFVYITIRMMVCLHIRVYEPNTSAHLVDILLLLTGFLSTAAMHVFGAHATSPFPCAVEICIRYAIHVQK